MNNLERIAAARAAGDPGQLVEAVPYARFLGVTFEQRGSEFLGRLKYSAHLVGNATIGALHGGTIGALLESTAVFKLLWETDIVALPKVINITVEYLRSGKAVDTWARAEFTRHGRRVANVRVVAWQDDEQQPIAAAQSHFLLVAGTGTSALSR